MFVDIPMPISNFMTGGSVLWLPKNMWQNEMVSLSPYIVHEIFIGLKVMVDLIWSWKAVDWLHSPSWGYWCLLVIVLFWYDKLGFLSCYVFDVPKLCQQQCYVPSFLLTTKHGETWFSVQFQHAICRNKSYAMSLDGIFLCNMTIICVPDLTLVAKVSVKI